MCLLVLAWKLHPALPLLLAGNRDERHARATAALDWWVDRDWVGGRDLVAGGTWLAAARDGRYAVVTNFPGMPVPAGARSRGHLVPDYLAGELEPLQYVTGVAAERHHYAGFSVIVGNEHHAAYYSNAGGEPRLLAPGCYGLGNDGLDAPAPRLERARTRVQALVADGEADSATLFALWGEQPRPGEGEAPFIRGDVYGTRSTTILRRTRDAMGIDELSYDAHGAPGEPRAFRWSPGR